MKQQIRAELKQGIVRRWYLYILPFALGAVSTAAFLNRYALFGSMDRRAAVSIIWGLLRLHFPRYAGVYSESAPAV